MTAQIRRLREGIEDEAPLHYEGLPLRRPVRVAAWSGGILMVVLGVLGMTRGSGSALEPIGATLGALGVVLLILSWRFRLFEIIVGNRWLIVRCGPVRNRFGRSDVAVGEDRPADSWRRLYGGREATLSRFSHGPALVVPVNDLEGLRSVVSDAGPGAEGPES